MNKLCYTCRHKGILINQDIFWCTENNNMDLNSCDKYEPLPESVTYCASLSIDTYIENWDK